METELQEFYNNQTDPEYIYYKVVGLVDRSRRCNLWTDGVTEKKDETWEQCEDKIENTFKEKLGLVSIRIVRVNYSKGKTSSNKATTIVSKLLSYNQNKEVLKNVKKLKGSNIFINEDLPFETIQHRKEVYE